MEGPYVWGSRMWAKLLCTAEEKIVIALQETSLSDVVVKTVCRAYKAAFDKKNPLRFGRFTQLKLLLLAEVLPSRVLDSMRAAEPCWENIVQTALAGLMMNAGDVSHQEVWQQLETTVRGCIIKHITQYIELRLGHASRFHTRRRLHNKSTPC